MGKFIYPSLYRIFELHDFVLTISWEWGLSWIIDKGAIEKVINLVQNNEYYPTFYEKISYLLYGLVMNHWFADGNKRTALATTADFIWGNTQDIMLTEKFLKEFENVVVAVASKKTSKEELTYLVKLFLFSYL